MRQVPHFIIPGAMKSGTTSLFFDLVKHPQIIPPKENVKEVNFFDFWYPKSKFEKGFDWYADQFEQLEKWQITGEASATYLYNPAVAQCVRDNFHGMKVIFILRDPVMRSYSHYNHCKRKGVEDLDFMEALRAEDLRIKNGGGFEKTYFSYKGKSRYAEQLQPWFEALPRKQFKVIEAERYYSNPEEVLRECFEFLGVDPSVNVAPYSHHHITDEQHKNDFPEELRIEMEEYFKPYNEDLFTLIGERFNSWKYE